MGLISAPYKPAMIRSDHCSSNAKFLTLTGPLGLGGINPLRSTNNNDINTMKNMHSLLSVAQLEDIKLTFDGMFRVKAGRGYIN